MVTVVLIIQNPKKLPTKSDFVSLHCSEIASILEVVVIHFA